MNDNGPCYPIHAQTQYHNQITSGWKEECTFCVLGQSFNQSCGTKLSVCAPSLQGGKNLLTLCVNKIWRLLAERNIWFFNRRVFSLTVFVGNHTIFNKARLFRVWSASYLKKYKIINRKSECSISRKAWDANGRTAAAMGSILRSFCEAFWFSEDSLKIVGYWFYNDSQAMALLMLYQWPWL